MSETNPPFDIDENTYSLSDYLKKISSKNSVSSTEIKQKYHSIKIKGGQKCLICDNLMQRFIHDENWKPEKGKGFYFYWDYCYQCKNNEFYSEAFVPSSLAEKFVGEKIEYEKTESNKDKQPIKTTGGINCLTCNNSMQRFKHNPNWKPRQNQKYYLYWDYCYHCKKIVHHKEAYVTS